MAQAMASMAGSLQLSGSTRLHAKRVSSVTRAGFTVRAQHQQEQVSGEAHSSRRTVLSLVAAGLAILVITHKQWIYITNTQRLFSKIIFIFIIIIIIYVTINY